MNSLRPDQKKFDPVDSSIVEPLNGAAVLVSDVGGDPDNDGCIEAGSIREDLAEVRVVGGLKLVLDNDDRVVRPAPKDVEFICSNALLLLLNDYRYAKKI